jgi:coenzyme F420-reducing hydrogenase alpha subunit
MERLIPNFEWGLQAAIEATRWVADFDFPDHEYDYDFVALGHPDEYPLNEGAIVSSDGSSWEVADYEQEFIEHQVPHSTALQAVRKSTGQSYFVGPLARIHHNFDRLSETTKRTADDVSFSLPCRNPFRSIVARGLEVVHAYDEALAILKTYRPPKEPRVPITIGPGEGCAATEAPRGLLYHRYRIGADNLIQQAKIVPPTSQNQGQIERDLAARIAPLLQHADEELARSCERLIRNYDPCISCSTHFLKISWEER